MQIISIPKKRVRYLKENLKVIEEEILISIRFKEGLVEIEGDTLQEYMGKKVILAIAKGFDIKIAFKLLNEKNMLKTIELKDFLADRLVKRQIGRIIGEKGKSKQTIEEEGEVNINIKEHEVSIIGDYEDVEIVVNAIQKLMNGTPHSNVYRYISEARAKNAGKL